MKSGDGKRVPRASGARAMIARYAGSASTPRGANSHHSRSMRSHSASVQCVGSALSLKNKIPSMLRSAALWPPKWHAPAPQAGVVSTASRQSGRCIARAMRPFKRMASRSCGSHQDHSQITCSRSAVVPDVASSVTRSSRSAAPRSWCSRTSDLGKPRRKSRLPTGCTCDNHWSTCAGSPGGNGRSRYSGTSATMRRVSSPTRRQCAGE